MIWPSRWKLSPLTCAPSMDFQLISQQVTRTINWISANMNFEAKEYRGCFAPSGKRSCKLRGNCPVQGACSRGENRQKMHLSGSHPSPSGALVTHRETPTLIGGDLEGYTKSEKLMLHTHSESAVPTGRVSERHSISWNCQRLWQAVEKPWTRET